MAFGHNKASSAGKPDTPLRRRAVTGFREPPPSLRPRVERAPDGFAHDAERARDDRDGERPVVLLELRERGVDRVVVDEQHSEEGRGGDERGRCGRPAGCHPSYRDSSARSRSVRNGETCVSASLNTSMVLSLGMDRADAAGALRTTLVGDDVVRRPHRSASKGGRSC